jgi:DNA replication and repair protein RecF
VQLTHLTIKNFRCFSAHSFDFSGPRILIQGANGSGKTTLLEAIHYACYLRSFRTRRPQELITFDAANFALKAQFTTLEQAHELHIGVNAQKKLVKINQKTVHSYKELLDFYRVITVTQDDLALITGSPEDRRAFLDHMLILMDPDFIVQARRFKQVLEQRAALLRSPKPDRTQWNLWTEQLWQLSCTIGTARLGLLDRLATELKTLMATYGFEEYTISFDYQPKRWADYPNAQDFLAHADDLYAQESRLGRTLAGAHLDDLGINFAHKKSRLYASRGQQKLIVILAKIAQMKLLNAVKGPGLFLLDDFMTDFDDQRVAHLLPPLLDLPGQVIFTAPHRASNLEKGLAHHEFCTIELPG